MEHQDSLEARRQSTATAGRALPLLTALGALLAASGSPALAQRSVQQPAPTIQAPVVRSQVRVIAPRVVTSTALSKAEVVAPNLVNKLVLAALQPYTVEAEDWGEMPSLGFTVQDMSGWGNQWSGNKQIFWNPQEPGYAFKWDFSATAARMIRIYLTAAPDYAPLTIRLGCYRQVSEHYYQLQSERETGYTGYAPSVSRKSVSFYIGNDPKCVTADMFRLLFIAKPTEGRTFGGIDSIVVQR